MYTKPDERDFKTTFYERFKKSGVWCPFKVKDFTVKSLKPKWKTFLWTRKDFDSNRNK